jgi:hypothetical protein
MKPSSVLGVLMLAASLNSLQDVRPAGVPPGAVQAGQAEARAERDIPPPIHPKPQLNVAQLEQQADELAKLAQTIPVDIASVNKGMLPKDVLRKLRQIEKLSRRLRNDLGRQQ